MRKISAALAMLIALLIVSSPAAAVDIKADFVFLIDGSASMSDNIVDVRNGFSSFVGSLDTEDVDARFAIVMFGGEPELILDFTSDAVATQAKLNSIVIGTAVGVHNNHNLNPEAGLEALRMALGGAANNNLANNNIPEDGILNYRADARKNLILVTDEDADRPFHVANRFTGQTTLEPPAFPNASWQAEVDATAQAAIAAEAFINLLIGTDAPSAQQYGNATHDVSDANFLNFDPDATLQNLIDAGLGASLQAQVLAAGLIGRSFAISQTNDADFVNNFFAAKVEEVVTNPPPPTTSVPEPGTLALLGSGLTVLALVRSRRRL